MKLHQTSIRYFRCSLGAYSISVNTFIKEGSHDRRIPMETTVPGVWRESPGGIARGKEPGRLAAPLERPGASLCLSVGNLLEAVHRVPRGGLRRRDRFLSR